MLREVINTPMTDLPTESLRGHFLSSVRNLKDPNFFKTVVLMVEHNSNGAMGLVVNRPSDVTVSEALAGHFDLEETDDLVYIGGPVEDTALFILHNATDLEESAPLVPGVHLGGSADVFERVVQRIVDGDTDITYRVFSGYAGWAPGQLESELSRNDWFICPASEEIVFHDEPYQLWNLLLDQYRKLNPIASEEIGNPELN